METDTEIPEWFASLIPVIESWVTKYEVLSQEQRIWFWIAAAVVVLLTLGVAVYAVCRVIQALNTMLQSPDGWRPIRFKCWMWIGSGFWLLFLAHDLRTEKLAGWTVAAAAGVLVILGFIWFIIRRLKFLRGIGATFVNGGIGLVVAPVVIHSVILVLTLIIACIVMWIYAAFNDRRVVYVEYR